MGRKDPKGDEWNAAHERVLAREDAGEVEQRREEQLPEVIEGAEQIVRARARGNVRALEDEARRSEHRADAREEEHERGGAVRPLARRLAEDHDAEEEDQP